MNVIKISVSGPVQSGKSACVKQIENLLSDFGYACAVPERSYRLNPPDPIETAVSHECPQADKTVFILEEITE